MNINPEEVERILKKWKKVMDAGTPIEGKARLATAQVLENTQIAFEKDEVVKIPPMRSTNSSLPRRTALYENKDKKKKIKISLH